MNRTEMLKTWDHDISLCQPLSSSSEHPPIVLSLLHFKYEIQWGKILIATSGTSGLPASIVPA